MNNKKPLLIIGGIIIILIGLSLGTIGYMHNKAKALDNVFANNVYIEDLAVGGYTKEEAKAKLEQDITDEMSKHTVVFTNGEISKEVPLSDLGITYNINEIIDQAFNLAHDKGLFERYQIAKNGVTPDARFSLTKTFDENKLDIILGECKDLFYVEPINATLERVNRKFVTTPEVDGVALDLDATKEKALTSLTDYIHEADSKTEDTTLKIEVVTQAVPAQCTEASLEDVQTLVASFSTSYNNANANRNVNLKVASEKITTMILPNEVFKLSNYLEPFTEAAGYKKAGSIVNGKLEDEIGGGICQVASTLYNAVLLTDLEIVQRQNHSLAVSYVPLGRDATYSTDAIDFQFKNNSGSPIFIEGYCENNEVVINIYGTKSLKSEYEIKFASELIETIPAPATKFEDDPTLEEGKEVTETRALNGKRVKLYKIYYKDGVEVNRVLVNTSYYKPRAAIVKRGTKKPTATQPPSVSPNPEHPENQNGTSTQASTQSVPSTTPVVPEQSSVAENNNVVEENTTNDDSGFAIIQE